ncbi:MAG: carboxypeptidase regulatory-like domain-containing protein [Candidatus Acidiferrales bacterium]
MKIWKSLFLALAVLGLLVTAAGVNAQNLERGAIRGFIYDSTHSVVPNAKVTISNPSTGYKREVKTDAGGTYAFDDLLPGVYKVRAEAEGFAATEVTDITVQIGASLDLNVTLPVKGQTQTVTVSASALGPVDTTTAGINQVINEKDVEDLPLSGRDYRDLAQLSSSAQIVPGLRGGIRLGGQQSDYLGMVIDGQDTFNNFFGEIFGSLETKNFTIPLDAVQEFQVVTNGFAPEFGRATGGLVNVVTKSGTNEVHGEAHEYYRGSGLTATDGEGNPPNISEQNQFGGSIGFPIHKDRQFLFLAADTQKQNGPLLTNLCSSGSIAACNATMDTITGPTFADCVSLPCPAGEIPVPGPLTTGFNLPASCGTPTAGQTYMQACFGVADLSDLNGPHTQFQDLFTILGHYDYQFSPANHFSVRAYGTRNHTSGFTGGLGQNETPAAFGDTENFLNEGISTVFSLNTVMGRKVNELRVSVAAENRIRHANGAGEQTDLIGPGLIGERYYLPINGENDKLQVADNFSYSFGKHDMKFGGDSDTFEDRKDTFVGWSTGQYEFGDLGSFQGGAPYGLIQNLGLNNESLFDAGTLYPNYLTGVGLYWQDKWTITPRITLTYGLRWDGTWYPQPQTAFPGTVTYSGTGLGAKQIPIPQRTPDDFGQWGPRVGLAWNVGGTKNPTIVRGAWGYYYAVIPTIFMPSGGGGKTTGEFCFPPYTACGFPTPGFPYLYPSTTPLGINQLCTSVYGCPGPNLVDPNFKNPRVSSLTGSLEQSFAGSWTLTGTFAWVNSQHLRTGGYGSEEAWYRNFVTCGGAGQPPATDQFGRSILCGLLDPTLSIGTDTTASYAHGNYESVVINLTKRFSNRYQVFGNYIWSNNKDNGASERDTDTYFGQQDPFNLALDYGRNSLDIRSQIKGGGVIDLPWGFLLSSTLIYHSGVPFPLYIDTDVNGDTVANSGYSHNNDRPSVQIGSGKPYLLGRYPFDQPSYAQWDARLAKDFKLGEKYKVQLSGDFYNLTNRKNLYSNPDTNGTIDYSANSGYCTPWSTLFPMSTAMGSSCTPLTSISLASLQALSQPATTLGLYRQINQVAPGSTPFAFQAGVKFIF